MKKFTITIFEEQRESFLSALGFIKINEFSVKKSEVEKHLDVSFQCEPIDLYSLGVRFQFQLNEQQTKPLTTTATKLPI